MVRAGQLFVLSNFLSPHSSLIARHTAAQFMVWSDCTNGAFRGMVTFPGWRLNFPDKLCIMKGREFSKTLETGRKTDVRSITDSKRMTAIWLIRLLLMAAAMLIVAVELLHASPFIGVIVGVGSLAAAAIFGCWYIPAYFRRYGVTVQDGIVRIRHGVLYTAETEIPLRHVLTVSVSATPLMRLFDVRMVTLGLSSHRFLLHCVCAAEIEELIACCGKAEP